MKKIAIYVLLILGIGFGSVSCGEKFLEVDYYSIVNPDGVYEDADNVFMGLMGVYNTLYTADAYYIKPHPALGNLPALDLQADGWDAEMSTHSWGVESKSGFFEQAWKYSYQQVSRANLFLADLEKVTSIDEETKKIYESEARCIRGAAYYFLTINFSRVPMLLTGETYASSPEKARPESDAAAWKTIKDDFEYAAQYLDWKPAQGQIGRFTKAAALAYAAKANMYLGEYATAKEQLKQIIDNSGKKLNPVHGMIHWVDNPDSEETIWEISFPKFPKMGWDIWSFSKNNDQRWFSQQTRSHEYGGWGDAPISWEFTRSFEPGDKRLMYNVVGWEGDHGGVNPYTGDVIGGTGEAYQAYFMDNYEGMPNNHGMKWWKVNDVYSAHSVQLIRYTGVLLDYAECCFQLDSNSSEGWKVIADVRNRAWGNLEVGHNPNTGKSYLEFPVEILNKTVVPVPDAKEAYEKYKTEKGYSSPLWVVALTQERRKEFIQEFSFWYDLSRMKLVEEWLDCEYPKNGGASFYNTKTKKYYVPSGKSFNEPWEKATPEERENMIPVTGRVWDWNPIHLVYPIPTSELTANPLCEQNDGY